MSRSGWDEVARLRAELAAAWQVVERTERASNAAPCDQSRAEAHAALQHWSRTCTAMYYAIDECLQRDARWQPQVSRAGNYRASESAPGSEDAMLTGHFGSPSHGVDLASEGTWQPCSTSQRSDRTGEPTQSLPTSQNAPPPRRRGPRLRWSLGHSGLPCDGYLQVSTSA